MKVSDPILFGHAVTTFFASAFEKHGEALCKAGCNPNNGVGDVLAKVSCFVSVTCLQR
jgi:isocitrate dehydrogenase